MEQKNPGKYAWDRTRKEINLQRNLKKLNFDREVAKNYFKLLGSIEKIARGG